MDKSARLKAYAKINPNVFRSFIRSFGPIPSAAAAMEGST